MDGQLHGAFTCAGIIVDEPLIDANWEISQKLLNINVLGTFWTAKLVAKHLKETKTPGSLVFVASLSGQNVHMPVQHVAIYNASKGAIKVSTDEQRGSLQTPEMRAPCGLSSLLVVAGYQANPLRFTSSEHGGPSVGGTWRV